MVMTWSRELALLPSVSFERIPLRSSPFSMRTCWVEREGRDGGRERGREGEREGGRDGGRDRGRDRGREGWREG